MSNAVWGNLVRRFGCGSVLLAAVALAGCSGELSGGGNGLAPGESGTGGGVGTGDPRTAGTPGMSGTSGTGDPGDPFDPGSGGGPIEPGSGGAPGLGDGGSGGEPPPPQGSIPMFVAQGHAGRTVVSCDDGRSWVGNRSNDDSLRCFDPYDCDHDAGAARGITWGDGWFFATFGWGTPGGVQRSRDGVNWETALSGTTFGGVSFGNGRLVAASRSARYSDDQGSTWDDSGSTALNVWNVRRAGFVPSHGGRFLMAASDSSAEITVSADGDDWSLPTSIPSSCGGGMQTDGGFAYGNGTIVAIGSDSIACRSTDGGATWTSTTIGGTITSQIVWNGSEFMVWGSGKLYRSMNGSSWSSMNTSPGNLRLGPVAVSNDGTLVAVRGGWQVWYGDQEFYRSTDGVNWQTLAAGQFVGSHPIRFIAFGHGQKPAACP
ncbi:MAG: hypothetical protein AAF500_03800 [Myxococcota bacterium]